MGSGQSNLDQANIIKISESVVKRLENYQKEQSNKQASKPAEKKPAEEAKPKTTTIKNENVNPLPDTTTNISVNYGPPLTSLRVLQMKENELGEREAYWSKRAEEFRRKEAQLSEAMIREFEKAEKQINSQAPEKQLNELKIYEEKKKRLVECYTNYPDQLLRCDREVAEFADSVRVGNVVRATVKASSAS